MIASPTPVAASPWSRAADWALLATLLLAIFLMALSTELCRTMTVANGESSVVRVDGDQEGALALQPPGSDEPSIGSIQWTATYRDCGWPFPILRQAQPVIASWTLDDPPETMNARMVPQEHPLAPALQEELGRTALPPWYATALETTWNDSPGSHLQWWNALFTLGLVWLILYAAIRIPMTFLRASLILKRGLDTQIESRRSGSGRCPGCGYNLVGLDMSERCPECGTLLW